jgi:apolipoprotein D and lipocalin family protein
VASQSLLSDAACDGAELTSAASKSIPGQPVTRPTPSRQALRRILISGAVAFAVVGLVGCATTKPSIDRMETVDLRRFMGDWYVIGNIPTLPERDAYNAVESYSLDGDGRIRTRFRYREGAFDGPLRTMNPIGTVVPGSGNAVWGMQFIWPIKAEYVIVDVDPAYSLTIIGRSARDYAWIMARDPSIPDQRYDAAVARLQALGYDVSKLRRVPQRWPER